jgi:hypothetical protein
MTMTAFQREGLHLLGYTKRESEFLFLVATHSGYFTNRQFKAFAETESGSVSHAFIRKLLERRHATYRAYRSGERVYHVFARKLYQAIERENLRTRKKHELEYVKTRLVTLDFVLAHPQLRYLETEPEKIAFFERECGAARAVQPVKLYRARRSAGVTPRYFVDRFPLFLNGQRLTFTYVEAGAVALDAFGTHLRAYLALFEAVPAFDFLYMAPTSRLFRSAESEFQQIVNRRSPGSKCVSLLDYFRLRKAWDGKERVASADVVLLKEARDRFVGKTIEDLYERWQKDITSDTEIKEISAQSSDAPRGQFRTLVCGASLKVFADPLAKRAEIYSEGDVRASMPDLSGADSARVSGS